VLGVVGGVGLLIVGDDQVHQILRPAEGQGVSSDTTREQHDFDLLGDRVRL